MRVCTNTVSRFLEAINGIGEQNMARFYRCLFTAGLWCLALACTATAQTKPHARDLGVPFDGNPGRFNAITDVAGVEVGHTTLISGDGPLQVGKGPVRT